jgi:TRAP-type C4-dicarboxylate transport system permease small subunit
LQLQEERITSRCSRVILRISKVMAVIAALVLGIMMINAVADVCGRYFFLSPIEGTFELIGIMLVIAGSLGLGYCQLNLGNIRITILSDLLPRRGQAIVFFVAYLIAAVTTGIICWQGALRTWDYMFKRLGGTSVTLGLPYWPFMALLAIGFGFVCIIFLVDVYLTAREVFRRGSD